MTVDVTVTLTVQLPLVLVLTPLTIATVAAGICMPDGNMMLVSPAETVPRGTTWQVVLAAGVVWTTMPVGNVSTSDRVSRATASDVLVSVMVRTEVVGGTAFIENVLGANALASVTQPQSRGASPVNTRRSFNDRL